MAVFLLPAVAFAQSYGQVNNASSLFIAIKSILNAVIPIIIALAVVYILWGVAQSFVKGDEKAKTEGHMKIVYGIIGLFVMLSIWGLVNILVGTANLNNQVPTGVNGIPNLNQLPTNQ